VLDYIVMMGFSFILGYDDYKVASDPARKGNTPITLDFRTYEAVWTQISSWQMHIELVDGKQNLLLFNIDRALAAPMITLQGSAVCRLPASGILFQKAYLLFLDPDGDAILYFQPRIRVTEPGPVCLKLINLKKAVPHRLNLNPFAADSDDEGYPPNPAGLTPRYWLTTGYQTTRGTRNSSSSASTGQSSRSRLSDTSTRTTWAFSTMSKHVSRVGHFRSSF
jgi:hypothetical protein